MGRLRGLANALSPLTGMPRLPAVGDRIPQAAISHLATREEGFEGKPKGGLVALLLAGLRIRAAARGVTTLFLGLPSGDPALATIRKRMRTVELVTRLYAVHWPDTPAPTLDPFLAIHPEAGLM